MAKGSTLKIQTPAQGKPISAAFLKQLTDAVLARIVGPGVKRVGQNVVIDPPQKRGGISFMLAKITGNARLVDGGTDIWGYSWREISLTANIDNFNVDTLDNPGNAHTGGLIQGEGSENDFALNLCEILNTTGSIIGGDGIDPASNSYPGGFSRLPVGEKKQGDGRAAFDAPVMMFFLYDASGTTRPCFYYQNAHDGDCDEDVGGTP